MILGIGVAVFRLHIGARAELVLGAGAEPDAIEVAAVVDLVGAVVEARLDPAVVIAGLGIEQRAAADDRADATADIEVAAGPRADPRIDRGARADAALGGRIRGLDLRTVAESPLPSN